MPSAEAHLRRACRYSVTPGPQVATGSQGLKAASNPHHTSHASRGGVPICANICGDAHVQACTGKAYYLRPAWVRAVLKSLLWPKFEAAGHESQEPEKGPSAASRASEQGLPHAGPEDGQWGRQPKSRATQRRKHEESADYGKGFYKCP